MSATCIGELVRKMGERVLHKILPTLQVCMLCAMWRLPARITTARSWQTTVCLQGVLHHAWHSNTRAHKC